MSAQSTPRPYPQHRTNSPLSSRSHPTSPSLPSKYRIPPVPPRIHRKLYLNPVEDGISLSPVSSIPDGEGKVAWSDDAILIQYGPKGLISRQTHRPPPATSSSTSPIIDTAHELPIAGMLGLVRLWETSYLLIFLSPESASSANSKTSRIQIFPKPSKPTFPPLPLETPSHVDPGPGGMDNDPLIRSLRAIAEREGLILPRSGGNSNTASPGRGNVAGGDAKDGLAGLSKAVMDKLIGIATAEQSTSSEEKVSALEQGEEESGDEETHAQGTVFELKNVYAVPMTKDGAEGVIRGIKASMAKLKGRPANPRTTTKSADNGTVGGATSTTDASSSPPSVTTPTPLQAFTRALDPKTWVFPKIGATSAPPETNRNTIRSSGGEKSEEETEETIPSGELGHSKIEAPPMEDEAHWDDLVDVTSTRRQADESDMPDSDEVMAEVSGTQTQEEKAEQAVKSSFLGIGTGKVWNPFVRQSPKTSTATEARGKADVDAQAPGLMDEEGNHSNPGSTADVEVVEGQAKVHQDEKASVKTPAARKDFETKIVREICRILGGGGGMFYSYETDLSHNLQEKRKKLESRTQSSGLLGHLLEKDRNRDRPSLHLDSDPTSPSTASELSTPPLGLDSAAQIIENKDEAESSAYTWIEPDLNLPLWRRFDPRFMWNGWLVKEFQELGLHSYILPIMQGWVQASRFYIPPVTADGMGETEAVGRPYRSSLEEQMAPPMIPVDMVLISRRSKDRAGLRYLRRGIDEDGNVANFVETEMMIRVEIENKWNIFSFVQIRGSIPLVWTQTSTLADMKPPPVLQRSVEETLGITRLHFDDIKKRYGPVTAIQLGELKGKESSVTQGYAKAVEELDDPNVKLIAWDFHEQCRGLRYDKLSLLTDELDFASQGFYWTCNSDVMREQASIFRSNCIDCLDRTNVVQSKLARVVLATQLLQVGMISETAPDIEGVYNDAWANNGDQISREYAGTSALKGDFTRTGKQSMAGLLHDGMNSVSRMYSGAVSDFFRQAVISFMVGQRSISVFSELLTTLDSKDNTKVLQLSRIRKAAIETCSARVIEDDTERRIKGWTFLSPDGANVKSGVMQEKVVILTKVALYVVAYSYDLEKVSESTRIPLLSIQSLQKGTYILSPLQEAGRDPEENVGFIVSFKPTPKRMTSYTMLSSPPSSPSASSGDVDPHMKDSNEFFAFKMLPSEFVGSSGQQDEDEDDTHVGPPQSCRDEVNRVVQDIRDECIRAAGNVGGYVGGRARDDDFVIEEDVIGLAEAQKNTSLASRLNYGIKRAFWLP